MQDSDIVMFLSQEMSDEATNGGRASTDEVTTGIAQNVLPHVNKATRDAGNEPDGQVRKVHISNQNSSDEPWLNVGVVIEDTLGPDRALFWPETHDSTQSDWEGAGAPTRKYVGGDLESDVLSTDTALTITVKNADQTTEILAADKLYLSNQTTPGGSGDTAIVTISGTPSISTLDVTCNTTAAIGTAFLASNTKVSVIYEPGSDIEPAVGTVTETVAGAGTLDDTQIVLSNQGTIRQVITLTFTSATAFDVTSDETGVTLASGTTGVEYSPINPDNSSPYLTIPVAAWTAGFAAADEIEIELEPANIPMAEQRIVPVGCSSLANNRLRVISLGESET